MAGHQTHSIAIANVGNDSFLVRMREFETASVTDYHTTTADAGDTMRRVAADVARQLRANMDYANAPDTIREEKLRNARRH